MVSTLTTLLIAYVGFASTAIFVLLLGPTNTFKDTFVGKLHRFLTITLNRYAQLICSKVVGPGAARKVNDCTTCITETKHPAMAIFYLFIVTSCCYVFLNYTYPHIPGKYLGPGHIYGSWFSISFTYTAWLIAARSNPGKITKKNWRKACHIFPYDSLLYEPKICRTCKLQKPPRSKHCKLCKACFAQSDHHCAWINNCVGYSNLRWFLLFLVATFQICAYGAFLTFNVYREYDEKWAHDPIKIFFEQDTKFKFFASFMYFFQREKWCASLCIFLTLLSFLLGVFLGYNLYLLARGVTTNESFKWEDIMDMVNHKELFFYEKKYEPIEGMVNATPTGQDAFRRIKKAERDPKGGYSSRKPILEHEIANRIGGGGEPIRVKSLDDIDNLYDRGVYRNFYEMMFPKPL